MLKKTKKNKKTRKKTRRIRVKTRGICIKSRKFKKGGTNSNVNCCMCEKNVATNKTLVPQICLNEYGRKAHRICEDCWWDKESGFAREGIKHDCPGCSKKLEFTKLPQTTFKSTKNVPIIDLTEE